MAAKSRASEMWESPSSGRAGLGTEMLADVVGQRVQVHLRGHALGGAVAIENPLGRGTTFRTPVTREPRRGSATASTAVEPLESAWLNGNVKAWRAPVLALAPVVLAALAYGPILRNGFFADDFVQLYQARAVPLAKFIFSPHGGHLLVAQKVILAAAQAVWGPKPTPLFCAMLLLHLIAVLLLFVVVARWTASHLLASATAAWWGTLPVLSGALGWYSVLGQVVATIMTLAILADAIEVPETGPPLARRAAWTGLGVVAALSFGTGLGVALALPIALWWIVPRASPFSVPCVSLLLIVPLLYCATYYFLGDHNDFALEDLRRLVATAAAPIPTPSAPQMAATSVQLGAALGVVGITQVLAGVWWRVPTLGAAQWLTASAFVIGGGGLLVTAPRRWRRMSLALLTLLLSAYGSVAAARSPLIPPLSVTYVATFERYQYLPTALLAVLVALIAQRLGGAIPVRVARTGLAVWLLAIGALVMWLPPAIDQHAFAQKVLADTLAEIRRQIAAAPSGSPAYIENRRFAGVPPFSRDEVFPGWAALYVIFEPASSPVTTRRVFFIDANPAVRANANRSPYTAGLIVAPEDARR